MADDTDNPDDRPVGSPALVRAEPATDDRPHLPPDTPAAPAASTPGFFDSISSRISSDLAPLQERKAATMDRLREQTFGQADRDMAEARRAHDAISYSPNDMKSWDQEKESRKFATDPIQAFGSAGSVFAMIASAFTHAPMENALNGAAAAMNAVRAGDEREYERHYKSWKDNTNLAIKRHQMEREKYQDAVQLMQTNMGLGRAKMEAVAASFNDQKMLFLARNGLDDEVFKLMQSRASSERTMVESTEKIEEHGFRWALFQNNPLSQITEDQEPDPVKREGYRLQAAVQSGLVKGAPNSPQQIAVAQFMHDEAVRTGKPATGEAIAAFWKDNFGYGARPQTPQQALTAQIMDDPTLDTDQKMQKLQEVLKMTQKGGGSGPDKTVTIERQNADAVAKQKEKWREEGVPEEEIAKRGAQMYAKLKAESTPMTASQAHKVEEKKQKISGIVNQVDRVREMIDEANRKGQTLVGIPGKLGTVWEFVDRSTGKRTPHSEFTQLIRIIQSEALPILTGTTRLTKLGESARDEMIPGLGYLRDTKQVYNAMGTLKKVLQGDELLANPPGAEPAGGKPAGGASIPAWKRGVLVKPAAPATETAGSP